jgi:pyruvate ferredoxin oxidoreductase gamma subunit
MIEVRIHGRGGQGNVVAAYLLATAAFEEGRYGQAFPAFGAERRGAPVTAFVRIAEAPIRRRCEVRQPAFLIIQDEALLRVPGVLDGLKSGGGILVNSARSGPALSAEHGRDMLSLPATALAQEVLGRPVPNTALLAAFLTLTGLLPRAALVKALAERFSGKVLEKNTGLIERASAMVEPGLWKETQHAASA